MSFEDSLHYRSADKINSVSRKVLHDPKYFIGAVMLICAVIVSTVFFSQTACAEGNCQSSYECITCQEEKKACEENKDHMATMTYLSGLGAVAAAGATLWAASHVP